MFVDPKVHVLTPAPVPTFNVVAAASADILIAPTPDAILNAPPVEVT